MKIYPVMLRRPRASLALFSAAVAGLLLAGHVGLALAKNGKHPPRFLAEERKIIVEFFEQRSGNLPPGLAKRGGDLPPGLQRQLRKNGKLPPGLQKRLEPLPDEIVVRLPKLPPEWERVILGRHVILIDRRTARVLDIIENVIGLVLDH